jgi:hypothetical protein
MIADFQEFLYVFYREILFIMSGFSLVCALVLGVIRIIEAIDPKR